MKCIALSCTLLLLVLPAAAGKKVRTARKAKGQSGVLQGARRAKGQSGGLQDCKNDDKKFNICLDLNTYNGASDRSSTYTYQNQPCLSVLGFGDPVTIPVSDRTFSTEYIPWWMDVALEVRDEMQQLIQKDTVKQFNLIDEIQRVCPPGTGFNCGTVPTYSSLDATADANVKIDDIYISMTEGVNYPLFVQQGGDLTASAVIEDTSSGDVEGGLCPAICGTPPPNGCVTPESIEYFPNPTNPAFPVICSIRLYKGNANAFSQFEGDSGAIRTILLHETLHCLGLDRSFVVINDPKVLDPPGSFGATSFVGKNTLKQWNEIGCTGEFPLARQRWFPH